MLALLAAAAMFAAPAQAQKPPLIIYSSLPLQGPSRPQSEDVVRAIKLALRDHRFRAGGHRIKYTSLDDSTAAAGQWVAGQVKANALTVAQHRRSIAYIGEFNSGATANSLPTLNEAGILQVSPSNTARGLTRRGPGAEPGEPDKHYPAGTRTYGRVIPIDDTQAAAQVRLMKRAGVRRLFVLDDGEVYGSGVAELVERTARRRGIEVVGRRDWNARATRFRGVVRRVRRSGADAVFTGGIPDNNAPQLYKELYSPKAPLEFFAPDGMAADDFTRELPPDVQRRTRITAPTVAPSDLPPAGRAFYRRFSKRYNVRRNQIDPYAVYGYAAAEAVLEAIDRGGADRQAVVDSFFATEHRKSVLGRYGIDDHGDTTLRLYGAYRVRGGRLVYDRALRP